jgi:hypothetical protein
MFALPSPNFDILLSFLQGLATPRSKIRAGVACVLLFGFVVYYNWIWPQRLEAKLEARKMSISTSAIIDETLEILQAEDVSTNGSDVQIKQSLGTRFLHFALLRLAHML